MINIAFAIATKRTPNQGLKYGIKAINDRNIEIIKFIWVNAKSYNKITEAIKCQKTIMHVDVINLVTPPTSSCFFSENTCLIVKYLLGSWVVRLNVANHIEKQKNKLEIAIKIEARLPNKVLNKVLNILVPV